MKPFYRELCSTCGGFGLVDMGPNQHGGPNVSETCPTCKGKYNQQFWHLVKLEREERRQAHDRELNKYSS